MRFKLIVLMILIILFTIFVVQNTEPVNLQIFFWHVAELPKIILLVVTLVFGIMLGIFITTFFNRKKKNKDENAVKLKDENKLKSPQL